MECRTESDTTLGTRTSRHTGGDTSSRVTRRWWTVSEGEEMDSKLRHERPTCQRRANTVLPKKPYVQGYARERGPFR